ncbi:MAG: hypothetical protein IJ172_00700 [Ruminococcus sp.]|nr:hypothetical protein [Ruminococcus sp.]
MAIRQKNPVSTGLTGKIAYQYKVITPSEQQLHLCAATPHYAVFAAIARNYHCWSLKSPR